MNAVVDSREQLERVHDAFLIPENGRIYKFEAAKSAGSGSELGSFSAPPVELGPNEEGYRRVRNAAQLGEVDKPRGPALSVLPRKPDPATSQICCYLVNGKNIRASNVWTVPAWNSEPTSDDRGLLHPASEPSPALEILVAGGAPEVYKVRIESSGQGLSVSAAAVDLGREGELYGQLRDGLVAGTVWYEAESKVLPVVNTCALM